MIKSWMIQEKENEEREVYDDLRILTRHYLRPAIKLYNELNHKEFLHYSDYIALNLKTEQLALACNKLISDYSEPPLIDPDEMVSAMVDREVLANHQ